VILTAVSCSVYDESLLGSGPAEGGHSGTNSTAGNSGSAGEGTGGNGGSVAGAVNGGSSGSSSGDAGMMDNAGAMEAGGETSEGGGAGSSGSAGSAGSGGTAGSNAGAGGVVAAGSGGTVAGSGGAAGSAGSAGTGGSATATGCAKLSVPLDDANDRAHFVISIPSTDMTAGVISMHLYVQAGAAGTVFNYVQDSSNRWFGVTTAQRPLLTSIVGWQTLTFNVGTQADTGGTGIVKTDIRRIGIEINAAPATSGWSKPTVVYVDSVSVATPTLSYTFDTMDKVNATPSGSDVANQVLWQHSGSSDTTAAGVTLAWQGTCP